jgi:hypothetical protein
MTQKSGIPFYDRATDKLKKFVDAHPESLAKLEDTFGSRDVVKLAGRLAWREDILECLARVAGATPEEINEILRK